MKYVHLQDLLSLTMDINPNEIASQIADDHLGRFCDRIRGEIAGIVEKMCIDGIYRHSQSSIVSIVSTSRTEDVKSMGI